MSFSFYLLPDADQTNLNMVNSTPEAMISEPKQEQSCEDLEVDADLFAEDDESPSIPYLEVWDGRGCEPKTLLEDGGHLGECSMPQESFVEVSEEDSWTKVNKSDVVREQQEDYSEPISIQGHHIQDLRSNLHEIETEDTPCQQHPKQQLQSSMSAETESQQHPQMHDVAETKEQQQQTAEPIVIDSHDQQPQVENVVVAKEQQQQTAEPIAIDSHDQQSQVENVEVAKEQQQQTTKPVDSHNQQTQADPVAETKGQQQQTAKPVEVDDQHHALKNVAESKSPQHRQSVKPGIQQQEHKTGKIGRTEVKQQPQQQSQTAKIDVSKVKLQRQTAKVVEPEVNPPQEDKCVPERKPVQASASLTHNQVQDLCQCQHQPQQQNQDKQQALEPKSKKKTKSLLKKLNPAKQLRKAKKYIKQKSKDSEAESSVERTAKSPTSPDAAKSPTSPDVVSPNVDDNDDIDVAKVHFSQESKASSSKNVASVPSSEILEESNSNGAQLDEDKSYEATQESSNSRDGQLVTGGGASSSSSSLEEKESEKSQTKPNKPKGRPKQPAPRLDTSKKIEVNYKPPVRNTLAPKNSPTEQFYDILMIHSLQDDDLKEADYIKKIGKRSGWKVISVEEFPAGMTKFQIFATMLPRCTYTMLLLTTNFYTDVWCNHRYAACLTAAVENRTHQWSVIPIMFEESEYETPLELTTIAGLLRDARYFKKNLRSTVSTARRKQREEENGFESEPSPPPSPSPPDSPVMEQKAYGAAAKPTITVSELI